MMRRLAPMAALAAVLVVVYWFDVDVLIPMRRTAGNSFNPAPAMWTEMVARVAVALAVVGLAWLLLSWARPSRVLGLVYLIVGGSLVAAWPLVVAFHVQMPGFTTLGLWLPLGQSGLLDFVAPLVAALGIVRLAYPLPAALRPRAAAPASAG